jgi:hypothetical protein
MVHYALHYGQVANEHQTSRILDRCHQEEKEKIYVHAKHDKHKP